MVIRLSSESAKTYFRKTILPYNHKTIKYESKRKKRE